MLKFIFCSSVIFLFSCSDPLADKSGESTFESDVAEMVQAGVLNKEDALKIRSTLYLGSVLGKDLGGRSYAEILNSFGSEKDNLSFISLSKAYSKSKLDSALLCNLFKVQRKKLRGKVYFGFNLKNRSDKKVIAYSGLITISDVFGKSIYSGPFENQRKHITPGSSRELWIKLDKSNSDIRKAMKNDQCDFKWRSQVVIYDDGETLKFDEYQSEASEEYELELKSFRSLKNSI
ncbi:MAG: hypothetical protein ACJAZ2_000212 [Glaciecola sp.]|jgi:hypothetical protein